jgi:hypothetical protein
LLIEDNPQSGQYFLVKGNLPRLRYAIFTNHKKINTLRHGTAFASPLWRIPIEGLKIEWTFFWPSFPQFSGGNPFFLEPWMPD